MKLKHKYRILVNPSFLKKTVIAAAYGIMHLDDQGMSKERLAALYEEQNRDTSSLTQAALEAGNPAD